MKAWYFSKTDRRLRYDDNREIALGITHAVGGPLRPCEHGLHGSARLIDALRYAPGPIVWEVELSGEIAEHQDGDKCAATERTYLRGGIDVSEILRAFSRWAALSVASLWNMPNIVRRYLETGDKLLAAAAVDYPAVAAAYDDARKAKLEEFNTKITEMIEAVLKEDGQ